MVYFFAWNSRNTREKIWATNILGMFNRRTAALDPQTHDHIGLNLSEETPQKHGYGYTWLE